MKLAVVGAGIAGRMLAWRLSKLSEQFGYEVTIFDKEDCNSQEACSFAPAGILSPLAELEMAETTIFELGNRSMKLYPQWLKELSQKVFFRQLGSLVTAHKNDRVELQHFYNVIKRKLKNCDEYVRPISIIEKEAELEMLGEGLFLSTEGQIDPIGLMTALKQELSDCKWIDNCLVTELNAGEVKTEEGSYNFDWVFDCRGVGAKNDLPLRAVRGELLWLEAPDVNIEHLTRLMHPRYRIYIVPRPNNIYLVGATEIESEDFSPVSVRSSLELLSAAYSVHKGFGEARIIKSVVNCRPALPDNLPLVQLEKGLGRINGLYRHGILLAPALVEKTLTSFQAIIDNEKHYAINS
ncbi:MAG: FAD-dependent oxidoreductase [Kangiellaceae bacterium]|nr:FAD-dependent oxidoreductase [Kangiellaceae bacterium]